MEGKGVKDMDGYVKNVMPLSGMVTHIKLFEINAFAICKKRCIKHKNVYRTLMNI